MSVTPYESYRNSGVDWLGKVPAHWEIRRVRWLCEIKKRIAGSLGYEVLSVTQKGVRIKDIESNDGQLSMDYSKYQLVEVGDFAMNHMDLLTGYVDISRWKGVTSPDYRVFGIRDSSICEDRYLLYLFQMGYKNKIFFAYGQGSSQLGRWRLPSEQFNELRFPLPPKPEQQAISNFLDRETARINDLITKQERMIELLVEKRQALICQAVTHLTNSDVPLKDSGIAWLGKIAEHWNVIPLKYVVTFCGGGTPSKENMAFWNGQIPWVSPKDMKSDYILDSEDHITEIALESSATNLIKKGAVLIVVRSGILRNSIPVAINMVDVTLNQDMKALLPSERILSKYMSYFIHGWQPALLLEWCKVGPTVESIEHEYLANSKIPVPPISEQKAIVEYLDRETAKIDALIAKARQSIDLLKEHRTSLIAATVTGKIDVRCY